MFIFLNQIFRTKNRENYAQHIVRWLISIYFVKNCKVKVVTYT